MLDSNLSCYQKDLLFSSLPLKWCTNNRSTQWWNHGYSGNKFYLHHCEFLFIFVVSFIVGMYSASQVVAVALVFRKREGGNGGEIVQIPSYGLVLWKRVQERFLKLQKSKYALVPLQQVGEEQKETCWLDITSFEMTYRLSFLLHHWCKAKPNQNTY